MEVLIIIFSLISLITLYIYKEKELYKLKTEYGNLYIENNNLNNKILLDRITKINSIECEDIEDFIKNQKDYTLVIDTETCGLRYSGYGTIQGEKFIANKKVKYIKNYKVIK